MLSAHIQLTEEQNRRLEELSRIRRVSKSELVRQGIDLLLAHEAVGLSTEERHRRAKAAVGRSRSGTSDTSEKHDETLVGAYRS